MSDNFFALKTTIYMWLAFFIIAFLLYVVKAVLNLEHIPGADVFILVSSPYIASILFKKKMNLPLPEDIANKLATYFISSYLIFFYIIMFLYIANLDAESRSKLSEHITTLIISLFVMSSAIYYFVRLIVVMNLVKKK